MCVRARVDLFMQVTSIQKAQDELTLSHEETL